ncbi:MAG: hypothetical protein JWQ34_2915 [Mucilaginibacter sp.]|nr:hypothetical protein [Mucilaginibacter sp.]
MLSLIVGFKCAFTFKQKQPNYNLLYIKIIKLNEHPLARVYNVEK